MASLPTECQLLISLIRSVSSIPADVAPQQTERPRFSDQASASNALSLVPPSHRSLITTLHVLFPALVLPALDLLDRRLVTKVVSRSAGGGSGGRDEASRHESRSREDVGHREDDAPDSVGKEQMSVAPAAIDDGEVKTDNQRHPLRRHVYIVRSGQSTARRHWQASAAAGGDAESAPSAAVPSYLVHLDAWNCSCAGFAFAAYRGGAASTQGQQGQQEQREEEQEDETEDELRAGEGEVEADDIWDPESDILEAEQHDEAMDVDEAEGFGGLGRAGCHADDGLPCCKHLLACLLAEQWKGLLGRYVVEREMERDELAGTVAGI